MSKKKQRGFVTWIDFELYPHSLCFCYGLPYENILGILKKKAKNYYEAIKDEHDEHKRFNFCACRRETVNKKGDISKYYFLFFKEKFEFKDSSYVILSHELLHICQFYLPSINVNRDKEIEAEAYFHSFLMQKCLDKIRKNG